MCLSRLLSTTFGSNRFLMVLFFSPPRPTSWSSNGISDAVLRKDCNSSFSKSLTQIFHSHNLKLMLAWPLSVRCHYDKGKTIIQLENVLLREWGGGNSIKTLHFLPISPTWTFHPCNQCPPLYTLPARVISCLLLLSRYFHYRITWRALRGSKVLKNNLLGG